MCMGVPGRVVEFDAGQPHLAIVDVRGAKRRINIDLVRADGVSPGDWVDIHMGMALAILDEREAREALEILDVLEENASGAEPER